MDPQVKEKNIAKDGDISSLSINIYSRIIKV